ncbi:UNVERIFIED_CONTAM: RagB/SusD family nutrient uptake outer membrane protein, partial [Prevotella sp. 15_C9]
YMFQAPTGPYNGYNGWGVWTPTYDIVNAYQREDGSKYIVQGLSYYNISLPSVNEETNQIIYKDSTIQATKIQPWEGREMRFYAN